MKDKISTRHQARLKQFTINFSNLRSIPILVLLWFFCSHSKVLLDQSIVNQGSVHFFSCWQGLFMFFSFLGFGCEITTNIFSCSTRRSIPDLLMLSLLLTKNLTNFSPARRHFSWFSFSKLFLGFGCEIAAVTKNKYICVIHSISI